MNLSDHRCSIRTVINVPHRTEVKVTDQIEYHLLYSVPSKSKTFWVFKKCFIWNTQIDFKISNVFWWWLIWYRQATQKMLMIISPESDESRKLTYLKLPHLWYQQSFSWLQQLSMTDNTVQQTAKEEKITTITISVIKIKLSNPVQSAKNLMNLDYSSTVKWRRNEPLFQQKFTTPNFVKTKWSEDLLTESIILEDFTPVHLWRPHFGGDC